MKFLGNSGFINGPKVKSSPRFYSINKQNYESKHDPDDILLVSYHECIAAVVDGSYVYGGWPPGLPPVPSCLRDGRGIDYYCSLSGRWRKARRYRQLKKHKERSVKETFDGAE